jgi:peroxiredoxin
MSDFDVVSLPDTDYVDEGETAPDFTRPLVEQRYWEDVSLSELVANEAVVLVFHPMIGSSPATYIWDEIRERGWGERIRVVGVTVSTPYTHAKFLRERGLSDPYAIFSDPSNEVAERFGVTNDLDGMAGISEPRPAVYVVGEGLGVEFAWVATKWPEYPEYERIQGQLPSFD